MKASLSLHGTISHLDQNDRVVDGLRIPPHLDTVTQVNFVLTQEPGKLKPKDLKAAIEKNRAEREFRAEEQRKLREEGGGGLGGLDLRAVLAEEKLNINDGDAFKRQLREIAFLADVEEVEKQETEKEFRISEDYNGNNLLSNQDIEIIYQQRELARLHAKKNQWNTFQTRNATQLFAPIHPSVKPGVVMENTIALVSSLTPSFDPNRNDIWAKRLNSLRRLISILSRWVIQQRVSKRMAKIMKYFHNNHAFTREEIRAFIIQENLDQKNATVPTGNGGEEDTKKEKKQVSFGGAGDGSGEEHDVAKAPTLTVAEMILSHPHLLYEKRKRNEEILQTQARKIKQGEAEYTPDMIRRQLFPSYERNSLQLPKTIVKLSTYISKPIHFNDTAYYHCKTKPEYLIQQYQPQSTPTTPVFVPVYTDTHDMISGGYEEHAGRYAADQNMLLSAYEKVYTQGYKDALLMVDTTNGPDKLAQWFKSLPAPNARKEGEVLRGMEDPAINPPKRPLTAMEDLQSILFTDEEDDGVPSWMIGKPAPPPPPSSSEAHLVKAPLPMDWMRVSHSAFYYPRHELDDFTTYPQYRKFTPYIRKCANIDLDAPFFAFEELPKPFTTIVPDTSLRQQWKDQLPGGFGSLNCYFFGSLNSHILRQQDYVHEAIPAMGPTLSTYYTPDCDRHHSGLSCYQQDHTRDINEWDNDVPGLQQTLDKKDYLTDSESDSEDVSYQKYKPSMQKVRELLKAPPEVVVETPAAATATTAKGGKDKGKAAPAPVPIPVAAPPPTTTEIDEPLLNENEKKEEQVELLRDRKLLDVASTVMKARHQQFEQTYQHLISRQATSISKLQAMTIQYPFHLYEQEVYTYLNQNQVIPEIENHILFEPDPNRKVALPMTLDTLNSAMIGTESFSPTKK